MIASGRSDERTNPGPPDISAVMAQINALLDASIAADGFRIPMVRERPGPPYGVIDLSAIDFEALAKRFEKTPAQERRTGAAQAGGPGAAGEDGPARTRRARTTWPSSRS